MTVTLSPVGGAAGQFFDSNGDPLAGGKLYTYAAGTTTPETTYTSILGLTSNPNPIILNSGGRVPSEIWLTDAIEYKFVLQTSTNILIGTWDNITGINSGQDAANISFTGFKNQVGFVSDLADDDGSDWIGFDPASANAIARSAQDKMRDSVSVKDFGATGDGVTDDTVAINAAFAYAATVQGSVILPSGTYNISSPITIYNGVRAFIGNGGTLFSTTANGYVILAGIASSRPSNVSNCKVQGINLNANSLATSGIICQNVNNCLIEGNHLYNLPFADANGILLRTYKAGLANSFSNIVSNNIISGAVASSNDPGGTGIGVDVLNADLNYGSTGTSNPLDYWKATFTAADATYKSINNVIANNSVVGAYYGVSLSAGSYNTVTGNSLQSNIRGVSVQNCSVGNEIVGNSIFENYSSGIALAYGSSNNNIDGNNIYSTRSAGEGQLQAYVGCQSNKFSSNKVVMAGASDPQYMMYCAVMSGGNEFINNSVQGKVNRAMVGVESTWNTATTNPASRAFSNPAVGSGWANAGMSLVSVVGNTINSANASAPAIFFYQVTQGTVCSLFNCNIGDNRVTNADQNYQLELAEDTSGNLTNFILLNNNFFYNQAIPSVFPLARGRAHFAKCMGNVMFNDLNIGYEFPSGTTTPSVATLDLVSTAAYATATTITNFTNGMQGQTILVRLSANTTIQNNASVILKGGINIVGTSANEYVTLFNRGSGVWVEQTRNF